MCRVHGRALCDLRWDANRLPPLESKDGGRRFRFLLPVLRRRGLRGEHWVILPLHTQLIAILQLKLRVPVPHKRTVSLRYDPPVLIVASTWHETRVPFGRMLRDNLLRKYHGNEDWVSVGDKHDGIQVLTGCRLC